MTPRYLLKCAASILATLLGTMLLLADSTDDCEHYDALKASLDFTSDCPLTPSQGHVLLDFPEQGQNGRTIDGDLAKRQLTWAGFSVSTVSLEFIGQCSSGEGQARVGGITLSLGISATNAYQCEKFPLPVMQSRTVTCYRGPDASADPLQGDADVTGALACTITFQPVVM